MYIKVYSTKKKNFSLIINASNLDLFALSEIYKNFTYMVLISFFSISAHKD